MEKTKLTPWQQLKSGVRMIIKGTAYTIAGVLRLVDKAVHGCPYAVVAAAVLLSAITTAVSIGKARSERDAMNRRNYQLQQKLDTVLMVDEARRESHFIYHGEEPAEEAAPELLDGQQ